MTTLTNILTRCNNVWIQIVHVFSNVTGLDDFTAQILLIAIVGYIILLIVLVKIHRRILKKYTKIQQALILAYDTLRYEVAKAQYGNTANADGKGLRALFEAEQKNYLANSKLIRQEIQSIESKLGVTIISEDTWGNIKKLTKKKNSICMWKHIFGRPTTVVTIGAYKLFW